MQDPELGIQQSLADFKRLGYSDNWINQRLKSIEIRKDQCGSDADAKQFAARMSCEHTTRPTHPFLPSVGKSA